MVAKGSATSAPKIVVDWKKRIDIDAWRMFLYQGFEADGKTPKESPYGKRLEGRISRQSGGEEHPDMFIVTVGAVHSPNNTTTALSLKEAKEKAQVTVKRLLRQIIKMDQEPKPVVVGSAERYEE